MYIQNGSYLIELVLNLYLTYNLTQSNVIVRGKYK